MSDTNASDENGSDLKGIFVHPPTSFKFDSKEYYMEGLIISAVLLFAIYKVATA